MLNFPADRYTRAGATTDEILKHQAAFDALPELGKLTLVQHVASISDYDLLQELTTHAVTEPAVTAPAPKTGSDVPAVGAPGEEPDPEV